MDRVLDIDLEPPYVEVYQYAPLMYLSLCDFDLLSTSLPALEWLKWLHKVHCSVDAVATQCGVYKVKSASQGGSCAFSISPDMPPREQAAILLNCAKQLLRTMTEIRTPRGQPLAVQLTIHAGQFAGGIIGKGSWTYDLYGEQVTALLAMDATNSRNTIQVSGEALQLMPNPQDFVLSHKMDADIIVGRRMEPGASIKMYALKSPDDDEALHEVPGAAQQQQQQQQQPGGRVAAAAAGGAGSSGSAGAASAFEASPSAWEQAVDLTYRDAALEAAYGRHHSQALLRLDHVFILLSFLVLFSCCWGTAWAQRWSPSLLVGCAGSLAVPTAALALYVVSPTQYLAWREALWCTHRVVRMLALSFTDAYFNSSTLVVHWTRFAALGMLMDALGFKVRFRVHGLLTSVHITLWLALMWVQLMLGGPQRVAEGIARMLLGLGLPSLLLYYWEADHRMNFCFGRTNRGNNSSKAAGLVMGSGKPAGKAL